jgi:hypothetical protein
MRLRKRFVPALYTFPRSTVDSRKARTLREIGFHFHLINFFMRWLTRSSSGPK